MENLAQTIKNFILTDVNAELAGLATKDCTLPTITEKNIVIGTVDLSRYESPVVVSILPETQSQEEGFIDGTAWRSDFTITFLFQKAAYSVLMSRMCRYSKAFKTAIAKNPDFDGNAEESELEQIEFFCDTGAVAQQMTASEITINIITEEELA